MEKKRRTLDKLSDAGQDVILLLHNSEAGAKIEEDSEELAHRWDNLVQKLEDCSFQVHVIRQAFINTQYYFKVGNENQGHDKGIAFVCNLFPPAHFC